MVKNGKFRILLLELILANQLGDLPPVVASSGQEWQYDISTVKAHIGRSTGRSNPSQWTDLIKKNGNFRFPLLHLILANPLSNEQTSVMSTPKCLGTHIWQIKW